MNEITVGTYLKVFEADGAVIAADPSDEPTLDALYTRWVDSGERLDAVIEFTLVHGSFYKTRVSNIESWTISTPEARRHAFDLDLAEREEIKQMRQEAGIWDDPEPEEW